MVLPQIKENMSNVFKFKFIVFQPQTIGQNIEDYILLYYSAHKHTQQRHIIVALYAAAAAAASSSHAQV